MFKKNWIFILLLTIALILRISIVFWSLNFRENTDTLAYKDWAKISYVYGWGDSYSTKHITFGTLHNDQPPGSLYFINSAYFFQVQVAKLYSKITHVLPGHNAWVNGPLVNIFLKIPSILSDLFIGVIIFIFAIKNNSYKKALFITSIFLFNPVIWYNSAFWGQMDALNNMLFIFSLLFLYKNKYFLSILFFAFSLYTKISLLIVLPTYIGILLVEQKNSIKFLLNSFVAMIFIILLTLPVSGEPIFWFLQYFTNSSEGIIPSITSFSFNFWWFIFKPSIIIGKPTDLFSFSSISLINSPNSNSIFYGLSLNIWGLLLFALTLMPLVLYIVLQRKNNIPIQKIFLLLSLTILMSFLFFPRMHERYLYPFFVLFPVVLAWYPKMIWYYVILSILNLINLYLVWHPMKLFFFPYILMNNTWVQWCISLLVLVTSTILYIHSKKILYAKK